MTKPISCVEIVMIPQVARVACDHCTLKILKQKSVKKSGFVSCQFSSVGRAMGPELPGHWFESSNCHIFLFPKNLLNFRQYSSVNKILYNQHILYYHLRAEMHIITNHFIKQLWV